MEARKYWNPYVAGVALGLVLLSAFLVSSGGLGATALPKRAIAMGADAVAPAWTAENAVLGTYVQTDEHPLRDWLVIEVVGVLLGGFIAAVSAGRFHARVEKGPRISTRGRLLYAVTGGSSWDSPPGWPAAAPPARPSPVARCSPPAAGSS
jgi:uncharacterized protein